MSVKEMLFALADGDVDALMVCLEILRHSSHVDRDALFADLNSFYLLDALHIWGSRIYALWHDVCERDVMKLVALLRAHQLGGLCGIDRETLHVAIATKQPNIDFAAVVDAVQNKLPGFGV